VPNNAVLLSSIQVVSLLLLVIVCCCSTTKTTQAAAAAAAFSVPPDDPASSSSPENDSLLDRRSMLWRGPLAAAGLFGYGQLAYNALSVSDIRYPKAHEDRVSSTIASAFRTSRRAAAAALAGDMRRPLRVLEVGIGTDARLLRRGLYDTAIADMGGAAAAQGDNVLDGIELVGMDIQVPTNHRVLQDVQDRLVALHDSTGIAINFHTVNASITEQQQQQYADGYFDCIVCCLTLCSVDDPVAALQEMKRLLNPAGGTLGYVEHVAVDKDDRNHRFLEWQQVLLDPLQQRLANNCHLHRHTEASIASVLDEKRTRIVSRERFFVNNMWPVSCQCSGVIQRI
jgi:SAM-dependent methyltransferase